MSTVLMVLVQAWKSGNLGIYKKESSKKSLIQISHATNVGKVVGTKTVLTVPGAILIISSTFTNI